ncbi:hypothetical protein [Enterobacter cloacae]
MLQTTLETVADLINRDYEYDMEFSHSRLHVLMWVGRWSKQVNASLMT